MVKKLIWLSMVTAFFFMGHKAVFATENKNDEASVSPLKKILENAERADSVNYYYSIYNLDVFNYFSFDNEYNTDLKKNVFKKSSEYQDKLNELKTKKQEIQKQIHYVTISARERTCVHSCLSDYDIKKKGFNLEIGGNIGFYGTIYANAPKSVEGYHFPSLPVKNIPLNDIARMPMPAGIYTEELFFPVKEEQGLSIENSKEEIKIYFIFKISDAEVIKFRSYITSIFGENGHWLSETKKVIVANSVRVVIGDEQTGEVYFDRVYSSGKK